MIARNPERQKARLLGATTWRDYLARKPVLVYTMLPLVEHAPSGARAARARAPRSLPSAQTKQEAASLTAICEGTHLGVAGGGVPFAYIPTWQNRNTNGQVKTPRVGRPLCVQNGQSGQSPPPPAYKHYGKFFWGFCV